MNNNTTILNTLLSSINSFVDDFQSNLFCYLYESDIQCALFAKLRRDINQHVNVIGVNEDNYRLNLIYSEYLQAFDLCCLNPEEIIKLSKSDVLEEHKGHDDYIYYLLPLLVAIELKLIKGKRKGNFQSFLRDEEKLKKSIHEWHKGKISHWLSICYIHYDEVMDFHIDSLQSTHNIEVVTSIDDLDCSYAVTPTKTYRIKNIINV